MTNKVYLITYPDSFGGNLRSLKSLLDRHLNGFFHGIHILPFFPSSADRGFAPLAYEQVEPRFGSWADIEALAGRYDLVTDLMVNHISRQSMYFRDFEKKGNRSK